MGFLFQPQVYERVGILVVEVYEKGREICQFRSVKGPKGLTDKFYGFIKWRKRSIFVIDSYLNDSALKQLKGVQSSNQGM